ncbi:hypothetical protein FRC01_008493 [Tulasnella sp. 417]|nr:hypothetical protein FRC01_008493 [Tulasnella sp. 417]
MPNKICMMHLDPSTHLIVPTELSTNQVTAFPTAMIDSGTTSEFINKDFVERNQLPTWRKEFPRYPAAIDGQSLGTIDQEVQGQLCMGNHEEKVKPWMLPISESTQSSSAPPRSTVATQKSTEELGELPSAIPTAPTNVLTPADSLGKANGLPDQMEPSPEVFELPPINQDTITGRENDLNVIAGTSISARIAADHLKEAKPLEEVVPVELQEFLDIFQEPTLDHALPPHQPYSCKIDFVKGTVLPKPGGLDQGSAVTKGAQEVD